MSKHRVTYIPLHPSPPARRAAQLYGSKYTQREAIVVISLSHLRILPSHLITAMAPRRVTIDARFSPNLFIFRRCFTHSLLVRSLSLTHTFLSRPTKRCRSLTSTLPSLMHRSTVAIATSNALIDPSTSSQRHRLRSTNYPSSLKPVTAARTRNHRH